MDAGVYTPIAKKLGKEGEKPKKKKIVNEISDKENINKNYATEIFTFLAKKMTDSVITDVTKEIEEKHKELKSGKKKKYVKGSGRDDNESIMKKESKEPGMYSWMIDKYLDSHKNTINYIGCIPSDLIYDLLKNTNYNNKNHKKFSLVYNTAKVDEVSDKTKTHHWCAIYFDDVNDSSVEFYDSTGFKPDRSVVRQVFKFLGEHDYNDNIRMKFSTVKQQSKNNDKECGMYSIKFLMCRGVYFIPFEYVTGYVDSQSDKKLKDEKLNFPWVFN
jgi:hypothetical protein